MCRTHQGKAAVSAGPGVRAPKLACGLAGALLGLCLTVTAFPGEPSVGLHCRPSPSGDITTWLVAGPLAAATEAGPPKNAPRQGGKIAGATWRPVASDGAFREPGGSKLRRAGVSLSEALRPRRKGAFVLAAVIRTDEARKRTIQAGSYGALEVWVNSAKVIEKDPEDYAWVTIGSADVDLKAGENRIFCRITGRYGVAGFFLRLSGGRGTDQVLLPGDEIGPPERYLADSMRFVTDSTTVSKDSPVVVALGLLGGTVRTKGELSVRFRALSDGKTVASADAGKLDLARIRLEPVVKRLRLSAADSPSTTLAAELLREGRVVASKEMAVFCVEGLESGLDKLSAKIDASEKKLGRRLPVARLAAEKAALFMDGGHRPGAAADAHAEYQRAARLLADAHAGKSPFPESGHAELAYFSEVENAAQPYLVYIPSAHKKDPKRKLPLVVYLHGYVPEYDKHGWLAEDPSMNGVMEAEQCLLAVAFGRSNTDFMTVGELDVLKVVEEMKEHYPVDESRIYLYGYSMGGAGVWTITTHYPDIFAAGCAIAGRTDYYLWFDLKPKDVLQWVRPLIEADNAVGLVSNIRGVPVLVYHGTADTLVKKAHSTEMVKKLKAAGGTSEMRWIEGGDHWSGFDAVLARPEPVQWMKQFTKPAFPKKVEIKTYSPKYGRSHWVQITDLRRWGEPAEIAAEIADEKVVVRARNVSSFILRGYPAGLKADFKALDGGDYAVFGGTKGGGDVTQALRGQILAEIQKDGELAKTRGLTGPVKEAFNSPFTITYGTKGSDDERIILQGRAMQWQEWWFKFTRSRPPMIADTKVTDEMMGKRNIICFGTPRTHAVLAKAAGGLPIKYPEKGKVAIAGRAYSLANRGLIFCYPNPLVKTHHRYLVVLSGIPYGEECSVNHRLDFVPDFLLFGSAPQVPREAWPVFWVPEFYKAGRAVVAGYFDRRWRFSERLTWRDD